MAHESECKFIQENKPTSCKLLFIIYFIKLFTELTQINEFIFIDQKPEIESEIEL